MNKIEFVNSINTILSFSKRNDDFRSDLKNALNLYLDHIKLLDSIVQSDYSDWDDKISRINELINSLNKSVEQYFEGKLSSSYNTLKNELDGYGQKTSPLIKVIRIKCLKTDIVLFRGRMFQKNRNKNHEEMFHIPLKNRGLVKSYRYSMLGYPCLYLGSSINVCWEEMLQPRFDDLMISCFKPKKEIPLLDLRNPSVNVCDEKCKEKFLEMLLTMPLIIASSFPAKNSDDNFKPEYIVPQIITQYIIEKNSLKLHQTDPSSPTESTGKYKYVMGVIYSSTHKNDYFEYSDKQFENIAIPVIDVKTSTTHCKTLSNLFDVTDPTCYEFEELKKEFDMEWNTDGDTIDNYIGSKMHKLEERLKKSVFKKIEVI